jgi:putative ABC transport system substrate-binding protein
MAPDVAAKRLQLLKEVVPRASRVAVLWNAAYPGKAIEFRETQAAARALGVIVQSVEIRQPADFDRAFAAIAKGAPDALIAFSEPLASAHRGRIIDFAAKHRLPMISEVRAFADSGGLMTYGADARDLARRAAHYVDRIFRGAKPADLPVEQPTRFYLVINLRTARALGLTMPPSVLIRADHLIE